MYREFEALPKTSRVWIYQADRSLTAEEIESMAEHATTFCEQWAAHGASLESSFQILHNRFLVLAVNENVNLPSGCSIDASVNFVRNMEQNFNINFLDRTKVAFVANNEVFVAPLSDLKSSVAAGKITPSTITFNNLVADIGEFEEGWQTEAGNSWLKRYF